MASIWAILQKTKLAYIKNDMLLWRIDSAGPKVYVSIKRKIFLLTGFGLINLLLSLCAGSFYLQYVSEDINVFFPLKVAHDYFPNYYDIFSLILRISLLSCSYLMTAPSYALFYVILHLRIQATIFAEYVGHVDCHNDYGTKVDLFYNEEYQKEVERRFKFCIKRQIDFLL